ncbi:hypothetical protein LIER_39290 [Lithospermum erythrorhizon]|uniref:Uncharacterized protein n=1 Tax=Lithospermum erythrorhizon TaxID=34254 RepID=A0AAV3QE37_LITER
MEPTSGLSPRLSSMVANKEENEDLDVEASSSDRHIHSMNALEILRETVRILRYNSGGLMSILALLICPLSLVILSNVLVNQSIVKRFTIRLLLVFVVGDEGGKGG